MSAPANETRRYPRHDQMFPVLGQADIARLRRFGQARSFEAGTRVVRAGEVSPGLIVILSGRLEVSQDGASRREAIITHGANQFFGELTQLSDRPSLVDAETLEPVEALIVPSHRLRDLLVQEADLGERVMRALILRRVGLLESGTGGPIIVGPPISPTHCVRKASSLATVSPIECSTPAAIPAPSRW